MHTQVSNSRSRTRASTKSTSRSSSPYVRSSASRSRRPCTRRRSRALLLLQGGSVPLRKHDPDCTCHIFPYSDYKHGTGDGRGEGSDGHCTISVSLYCGMASCREIRGCRRERYAAVVLYRVPFCSESVTSDVGLSRLRELAILPSSRWFAAKCTPVSMLPNASSTLLIPQRQFY